MKNCYIIPECNHSLREAKLIRDVIAEQHPVVSRKKVADGGKGAIVLVTEKPIPEEDLLALGLSGPVGEGYAEHILSAN